MSQLNNSTETKKREQYFNPERVEKIKPLFWQGKSLNAFWTIGSVFSILTNIILIVILVVLGRKLFAIKSIINDQLLYGLAANFEKMDQANISTTINVQDEIQVAFELPLQTNTSVVLTSDVPLIANLEIFGLNPAVNITLKKGTVLPISLDILVPVDTMVPINLTVPVDIPLNETELHEPFVGLQEVVNPYQVLLGSTPDSWQEIELCTSIPGCEKLLMP
ncbi:MAG: hypothetical protein DRI56_01600 [Chloroflexota bacterium]|nr:MAG: hypothetical protein DRI56_01600 [Chloroflexota bacterium]